jgi:drug/metabolite transporter (DMT)-like permease
LSSTRLQTDMERSLRGERLRGTLIVAAGALSFVPDATLTRLAEASDPQIIFWRSLFVSISLAVVVRWRHGPATGRAYRAVGWTGLVIGGFWGAALMMFIYAINHTAVANALVIMATGPFFAALFTRRLIGEAIPIRTWWAMLAALAGLALTFAGAYRLGGLTGNLAALGVATVLGLNTTLIRRSRGVDMVPAISLGALAAATLLLMAAGPLGLSLGIGWRQFVPIAAMGFFFVPAALTLLTLGATMLPSPEVTLFMALETVLGPLLAWAVIHEQPPSYGVAGGVLVIGTLVLHSYAALRRPAAPT